MTYDPELPVSVACDVSPVGIGAVLSHEVNGVERPVMFVSRSLTAAEVNYSQLDREALAIVFALHRFYISLYGRHFTLISDNKPLTRIFHQHAKLPPLSAARLLRYAAYLSIFNYSVKHRSSEENANADYLSRFPVSGSLNNGTQPHLDLELASCHEHTINNISSSEVTSDDIIRGTANDLEWSSIIDKLQNNPDDPVCLEFTLSDKMIFKGNRIFIPVSLRPRILKELHSTHSGITKLKQLARRYCYWPAIDKDIEHLVRSCEPCALAQKSPKQAPLHRWETPSQNFSRVHIDYAGPYQGHFFLILVDAKSKWPEISVINAAPTTDVTIELLEDIFVMHGYPQMMVSDNASIFSEKNEKFTHYCKIRGIFRCFSAPGQPATNGLAERYVQILKQKLSKMNNDPGTIQTGTSSIQSYATIRRKKSDRKLFEPPNSNKIECDSSV